MVHSPKVIDMQRVKHQRGISTWTLMRGDVCMVSVQETKTQLGF